MSIAMDVSQVEGINMNMVGKNYQVTNKLRTGRVFQARISSSGQVTLPAEVRRILGVEKNQTVNFEVSGDEIKVKRPMTWEEFAENQRKWVEEEKKKNPAFAKAWEENKGKTPDEMLTEWANSPEGQQYFKEEYGI